MLVSEPSCRGTQIDSVKRRASIHALMIVYLASGTCSLIDEVVWVRLLKLIIGNTVYASSIVVSVFMAGLALGAYLMGRRCDRIEKPLRLYALIELAITITAVSLPWVLGQVDSFYIWFWRTVNPGPTVLIVVQMTLSALILLVPTILMGSTLPLLGRFVTSVEEEAGPLIGRLYALNVLGAALGTFLAGFILLGQFGVMPTLYIAAGLNLLVALGGYVLHLLSSRAPVPSEPEPAPVVETEPAAEATPPDRGLVLLGLGFFASGFVSIGYELLWMRSIVHAVGTFTFVFSAVLTLYLLGNVIGAALGAAVVRRVRNCGTTYAVLLFALGFAGVLYLPWLYLCSYYLFPSVVNSWEFSIWTRLMPWQMFGPLVKGLFLFLVPSIIMGMGMPIMVQAWVNHTKRIGWSTGLAYCTNTVGAVAGGLLTGFVLIPLLGVQRSMIALGLATMWIAAILWFFHLQARTLVFARRLVLALAAILVTVHLDVIPKSLYAHIVGTTEFVEHCEVVAFEEGVNTIVSLHRDPADKSLRLCTSGRMVAGTDQAYRADQKMLGHFPILLCEPAQRALSVGFGTGESTACLSKHDIEQVACAEIAPEVVKFSLKYFSDINLGDRLDEEVRMIYMDARNYLHLTEDRYDVIINDCTSIRGFAENGSLFTKEYFESARDCLTEDGMFMSWIEIQSTECTMVVNSVIGTVMEVFPYVTLWYIVPEPMPFYMIVGSDKPQTFSIAHIERELSKPAVAKSLAKIHCYQSTDIMSCYIADRADLEKNITPYLTNSDFFPVVEFCPENFICGDLGSALSFFNAVRSDSVFKHIDWTGIDEQDKAQWLAQFDKVRQAARYVIQAEHTAHPLDKLRCAMTGLALLPDYEPLIGFKRRSERMLFGIGMKHVLAEEITGARLVADQMAQLDPDSPMPWMLRSQASQKAGDTAEALRAARHAVTIAPDSLNAQYNLWSILVAARDLAAAKAVVEAAGPSEASMP